MNREKDIRSLLNDLLVTESFPVDVEIDAHSLLLCCHTIIEAQNSKVFII